jgi:hypothetical protein
MTEDPSALLNWLEGIVSSKAAALFLALGVLWHARNELSRRDAEHKAEREAWSAYREKTDAHVFALTQMVGEAMEEQGKANAALAAALAKRGAKTEAAR